MLNVTSLNNIRDQKLINKFEIYSKVLQKCHHRILISSNKGDTNCFYVIPEYIFGIPMYDTLSCAQYIVTKLKKNGLRVIYTYPNLIYISWDHIPSTVTKATNNKKPSKNKLPKSKFREITDYKTSYNFINKIT